jgi:hypothetical protein
MLLLVRMHALTTTFASVDAAVAVACAAAGQLLTQAFAKLLALFCYSLCQRQGAVNCVIFLQQKQQ